MTKAEIVTEIVKKTGIEKDAVDLQRQGLRVIAVASKDIKNFDPKLVKSEFKELKFGGFLSFADVPKKDVNIRGQGSWAPPVYLGGWEPE